MRGRWVLLAAVTAAVLVLPLPTHAAEPLRSGRIVTAASPSGQWDVDGGNVLDGCMATAECRVWRLSGCDPALAGRDPGVLASIVDVADLADGVTPRSLAFAPDPGVAGGWVFVEFGSRDCKPIGARQASDDQSCGPKYSCKEEFVIPKSARWMTITSRQDNVNIVWTLT